MSLKTVPYHKCFDTLSNELRVQIIQDLMDSPKSVQELCNDLNAEQSHVSHSLQNLKTCNYVEVKKLGKQRIYSLKDSVREELNEKNKNVFQMADYHFSHSCGGHCNKC